MQNYNPNMEQDYADLYSQYAKLHTNNVEMDSNNGVLHYQTNDMKPIGLQPELQSNSSEGTYGQLPLKNEHLLESERSQNPEESPLTYENDVSHILIRNNEEVTASNSSEHDNANESTSVQSSENVPSEKSVITVTKSEENTFDKLPAQSPESILKEEVKERVTDSVDVQRDETKPVDSGPQKKEKEIAEAPTIEKSRDVCRVCMDTGVLISIFDNSDTMRMCEKVMTCAAVEVAENDGLPEFICKLCASDLETAYKFKNRCESSDKKLREKLGLKTKTIVKTEFVLIECENEPIVSDDNRRRKRKYKETDFSDDSDPSYGKLKKRKRRSKKKSKSPLPSPTPLGTRKSERKKETQNAAADSDDDVILVTKKSTKASGKYPCTYCEKTFPYPSVLKLHIVTHTKEKTHKCSICAMTFMYSKDLYSHYKDAHPNEYGKVDDAGKYNCKFCDKSFSQLKNLKVHEAVHSRDKKYKCELCSQGFTNMTALNLHKKQDHPGLSKPFKCKICDKRFKQEATMEKHLENHKRPVEVKPVEEKKPTSTKDLFKSIAPVTTTYWSDSFSD